MINYSTLLAIKTLIKELSKEKKNENGEIPEDLNFMEKYCQNSGMGVKEIFRYFKTLEYFFVKEFLHLLDENIFLDS